MDRVSEVGAAASQYVGFVIGFLALLGSEFWSTIAGAIVGGLIAYFIQRSDRKAARQEREEDRFEERKAHGYSLLFKAAAIHSSFTELKEHVDDRLAFGRKVKAVNIASVLSPIANLPPPVEFAAPEMAMLLSLKDDDVFNTVSSLDRIHNTILPAWQLYEAKRALVLPQGTIRTFDAADGKSEFTYERGGPLEVAMYEAEQLAKELVRRSKKDFAESDEALKRLVSLLNERLHLGIGIK
jgi:hypothetical protein